MTTIRVFQANREIDRVFLHDGAIEIGRDVRSRIHLDSSDISLHHGRIFKDEDGFHYQDNGSTNGSLLNGSPVTEAPLKNGDIIQIGDYQLIFSESASPYSASERTMAVELGNIPLARALEQAPGRRPHNGPPPWLTALVPGTKWIGSYDRNDLKPDLLAGLTIAALLVPQGMAYALLAGLPPVHGLYAAILPLLLYAFFGTSRHLAVGPVALDSLLVASGVGAIATAGTDQYIQLVIVLTLMIGVLQLLMGVMKLGFVVNFLSRPVLTGFTMAAAIIIAVGQLDNLLVLGLPQANTFFESASNTLSGLSSPHLWTAAIGIGGIVVLQLAKQFKSPIPGAVLLLIIGTLLSWLGDFANHGVEVVGNVPSGLPAPTLAFPAQDQLLALLPLALTLSFIGFMETLSTGKNYASRFGYRIDPDAEFRALGVSNLGASLSGGFPIAGGLSRTAVNVNAGARTQLAAIVSAILVLLSLALLTPLFYHIPVSVLAAIIVFSVVGLIDIAQFRYLASVKPLEIAVLLTTLLTTLAYGFTVGLAAGVLAALVVHIIIQTRPNISLLGRLPNTSIYRSIANHPEAEQHDRIAILRIDASFYFANAEFLQRAIAKITETDPPPRIIVLDASSINDLDSSGDSVFRDIYRDLNRHGIRLYVAGIKSPVRDVLIRSGLYDEIGAEYFFYTVEAAMQRIKETEGLE